MSLGAFGYLFGMAKLSPLIGILFSYLGAIKTKKQVANLFDLAAADGAPVEASQRRDQAVRQQQDRRQEEEFQGAAPQANS